MKNYKVKNIKNKKYRINYCNFVELFTFINENPKSYMNQTGISWGYATRINEFGKPVERSKEEYPYSYDGFVTWRGGKNEEATSTIYSDRLLDWDYKRHDELCVKHFGDKGQVWYSRDSKKIEAFLRDWTGDKKLKLIFVMEYCNQSSGYPLWRFDYKSNK